MQPLVKPRLQFIELGATMIHGQRRHYGRELSAARKLVMARRESSASVGPATLRTHHVFLDTQVYRRFGHNPESPPLVALRDQIAADRLVLHITDITFAEITRQIIEWIGETGADVRKAQRSLGRWRQRHPKLTQALPDFDAEKVANAAVEAFRRAMTSGWDATQHVATAVPAAEIFDTYFKRKPPFQTPGKKEFPDAFVVRVLEKWCIDNRERMYVVGADKAMSDAAADTEVLIPMTSLAELLEAVATTETPDVVQQAQKLLEKPAILLLLDEAISSSVDELIPIYTGTELADGEVSEHEYLGPIEFQDVEVLAVSEEEIRVLLKVEVPLTVTVDYEDRSMAQYDREDDMYIGGESASAPIETFPVIRVFAKLQRDPPGVTGVQILTGEFDFDDVYEDYG